MRRSALFVLAALVTSCFSTPVPQFKDPGWEERNRVRRETAKSFEEDVLFLQGHGTLIVLEGASGGRVAVSPKYQGRVMTSAVEPAGRSLGWIHRKFIEAGKTKTPFDNYGGEDRFWLGPEGGQFSLYFASGDPFRFDKWQTPGAFQEGEWAVSERTSTRVVMTRAMKVTNYLGTTFELEVTRTVSLLGSNDVEAQVGARLPHGTKWVAFETQNKIKNVGKTAWTKEKGLLSVWILGMYNPTPDTYVAIPFEKEGSTEIVNDRYFGKVPDDRLSVSASDGILFFKCDGKHRSKIGLGPKRAKRMLGSYSPSAKLLTVVGFDRPEGATDYVNSMWEMQKEPYAGDAVNSYNDGPPEPGKPPLGGFYELETSSPAAALAPGESLVHTQRTMHFVADAGALDPIATKALGASTARIAAGR